MELLLYQACRAYEISHPYLHPCRHVDIRRTGYIHIHRCLSGIHISTDCPQSTAVFYYLTPVEISTPISSPCHRVATFQSKSGIVDKLEN